MKFEDYLSEETDIKKVKKLLIDLDKIFTKYGTVCFDAGEEEGASGKSDDGKTMIPVEKEFEKTLKDIKKILK